jgi:thermitase
LVTETEIPTTADDDASTTLEPTTSPLNAIDIHTPPAPAPSTTTTTTTVIEEEEDFETNLGGTTRLVTIQPGTDIDTAVQQLDLDPNVEYVEKDYRIPHQMIPNDPKYWPYGDPSTQWQHIAIKSEYLWNVTTGPPNHRPVKICIPDSGLMMQHPDFMYTNSQGRKLIQGWSVIPLNSTYDEHGRYINPIPKPGSKDFYNYDDRDKNGHGTAVAGLLGAVGNNGKGMAGLLWKNVMIYSCRFSPNDGVGGYESDLVKCLDLCQKEGIKIYSCSNGGGHPIKNGARYEPTFMALKEKIQQISDAGGLYITGSANEDINIDVSPANRRYPASFSREIPGMLVVGGSRLVNSATMTEAPKWGYGKQSVHIMAPAENLLTTWNQKNVIGDYYAGISGVSGAVPTVAGAVAILKSMADQKKIGISLQQIKSLIMKTVDKNILGGRTMYKSGGRLNVNRAMQQLLKMEEKPGQTARKRPPKKKPLVKKKPTAKKPTAKKPTAKKPTAKKPTAKKPTAKKPTAKKPTVKKPTAKKPTGKKPTAKKPTGKKPTAKKPTGKKPTAKKPTGKKPTAKKPTAKKKPTTKKSSTRKVTNNKLTKNKKRSLLSVS